MNIANAIFVLMALILSINPCNCDDFDYGNVSPGFRVFDPPPAMVVNVTQIIFAVVTRSDLSQEIEKGIEPITVTPIMEAELTAKDGAFIIRNMTESIQTVSEIDDAVWVWRIYAPKIGLHNLYINIFRFNNNTTLQGTYNMQIQKNDSIIIFGNNNSPNQSINLLEKDHIKLLSKNIIKIKDDTILTFKNKSIKTLNKNSILIFENNNTRCTIRERENETSDYESILVKEDFSLDNKTVDRGINAVIWDAIGSLASALIAAIGLIAAFKVNYNIDIHIRRRREKPSSIRPPEDDDAKQ
jgi:hypothetical protein